MRMRKPCLSVAIAVLGLLPARAFAWSEATHAYIADHIGKSCELSNLNEMYGAMVADLYTTSVGLVSDAALAACVRSDTHGYPLNQADGFTKIWTSARRGFARNAAFGYISHNDLWGADNGAHWVDSSGTAPGYTIRKALQLIVAIQNNRDASGRNAFDYLGMQPSPVPPPDPLADPVVLLTHYLIERAGDVVIRRHDAAIGLKVAAASALRTESVPQLMGGLIGVCPNWDATKVTQAEAAFREQTFTYGIALLQDEAAILATVGERLSQLVRGYLEAQAGQPLPPAAAAVVEQLVTFGLQAALTLIQDDYLAEIDTIAGSLELTMRSHGFYY